MGGSNSKKLDVEFPEKQVKAFLNKAHTTYNFPIELRPILRLFLKSINLKYCMMSPNNHSTDVRTFDIESLKASICGVRAAPFNGAIRFTLNGYAGSPYIHISSLVGDVAYCSKLVSRLESGSIATSCRFPSVKSKNKNKRKSKHKVNSQETRKL